MTRAQTRRRLGEIVGALAIGCTLFASTTKSAAAEQTSLDKGETKDRALYFRTFFVSGAGIGLRFNNPYRLSRPLGNRAESLSLTAPYADLGVGVSFGDPMGVQHGGLLRYDRSLQGVGQDVFTPSYVLLHRKTRLEGWGRLGLPILVTPDPNVGFELALGGAYFLRSGLGISIESIGDLFFGASTPEKKRPIYPVVSLQLGVIIEWERLP
ncbi:MAG: hypothetical protein NVS3B20_20000 [Polyangiales bacterium]